MQAIEVNNLGKQYRLSLRAAYRRTFGEVLSDAVKAPWRRLAALRLEPSANDAFWALRDVSFNVAPGEVVGVIGRNGAGKSTLLKVLARITAPSTGRARISGRVGSLLEVGTGFHPELTGRENIFLNGAILGMRRCEIAAKFDQIVAFSEIERFLDTPVKRYSSGMYVRLAFAVAAHLEPEILFVDEVLAVGDIAFQRKCLGKMGEVARQGRTVLFVSHNMDAVSRLCRRGIVLDGGRMSFDGPAGEAVRHYLLALAEQATAVWQRREPPAGKDAWISRVEVLDAGGNARDTFIMGEPMRFRITYEVLRPMRNIEVGLALVNDRGHDVAAPNSRQQFGSLDGSAGTHVAQCSYQGPVLTAKRYFLRVDLSDFARDLDSVDGVSFFVNAADYFRTGRFVNPNPAVVSNCVWEQCERL
jgi:lipopolysaccharide transport system ATP-binding protein